MPTQAQRILARTDYGSDKEKMCLAEFQAVRFDAPIGSDVETLYYIDGSVILVQFDHNLQPVEFLAL